MEPEQRRQFIPKAARLGSRAAFVRHRRAAQNSVMLAPLNPMPAPAPGAGSLGAGLFLSSRRPLRLVRRSVIAGHQAASWQALSVAMDPASFEVRGGAVSGLLSLTNPASQKACRSALNITFRYAGVSLRPR